MERITHLKHSNTQLALQNKANGLGFRNFKKFQVFILLAICLGSRQMKTWEYEYINHLWKLSDNILFQKKKISDTSRWTTPGKYAFCHQVCVCWGDIIHCLLCFRHNLWTLMVLSDLFKILSFPILWEPAGARGHFQLNIICIHELPESFLLSHFGSFSVWQVQRFSLDKHMKVGMFI